MKRKHWLRWIASVAGLVLGAIALMGIEAIAPGGTLALCVDWIEGFTGHTDGIALAVAAAPALSTEMKTAIEKLIGLQKEQDEKHEAVMKLITSNTGGVSELGEQVEKMSGEVATFLDDINKIKKEESEAAVEALAKADELNARLDKTERRLGSAGGGGAGRGVSVCDRLFKTTNYEDACKSLAVEMPPALIKIFPIPALRGNVTMTDEVAELMKADDVQNVSVAAFGGDLVDPRRLPGVILPPDIPFTVQQLLPTTIIPEGSIDWVKEDEAGSTIEEGATPVAESTDTAALVHLPQVILKFTKVTAALTEIGAWVPATDKILREGNRARLMNLVNNRLTYAVGLEVEDQVIKGSGTPPNWNGLVTQATAYNRNYFDIQGAPRTHLDTLYRAKTQVRLSEYPTTGFGLHPDDMETIALLKDTQLRYIFASPGVAPGSRIWGIPVAESQRFTTDEFLVGSFALAAEIFMAATAMIAVAREHKDFFTAGLVAIKGLISGTLAVYRTKALVTGTFTGS